MRLEESSAPVFSDSNLSSKDQGWPISGSFFIEMKPTCPTIVRKAFPSLCNPSTVLEFVNREEGWRTSITKMYTRGE